MKTPILFLLTALLLPLGAEENHGSYAAALTFLEKRAPEIYAEISSLRDSAPTDYRSALDDAAAAAEDCRKLEAAGETEAAGARLSMYEIDFEAIGVADEIVQSTDAAQTERLTQKLNHYRLKTVGLVRTESPVAAGAA